MTLVATISNNQLWQQALEQGVLPIIHEPSSVAHETESYCLSTALDVSGLTELISTTDSLVITYASPTMAIADLIENGLALEDALEKWKLQVQELLDVHKRYRNRLSLIDVEQLTICTREGFDTLFSLGWPVAKKVTAEKTSIYTVIAHQALLNDEHAITLKERLRASSYSLSTNLPEPNLQEAISSLSQAGRTFNALQISEQDREKEMDLENRLLRQLIDVQEQLESYYLAYKNERKENDKLISEHAADARAMNSRWFHEEKKYKQAMYDLSVRNDTNQSKALALSQQLAQAEEQLDLIKSSTLWKANAPFRAIGRIFRKGKSENAQLQQEVALISASVYFDKDWYLNENQDVRDSGEDPIKHYLLHGAQEGRQPSLKFDSNWYVNTYPDVAASGLNPLVHFLRFGSLENRSPAPNLSDDHSE